MTQYRKCVLLVGKNMACGFSELECSAVVSQLESQSLF